MKKKNNIFTDVQLANVPSSVFDLSHDVKLSFNMGQLVPTCVIEVLPGDKFRISPENLLRFAPLVSPVMHRVRVTTHFFFVPNRIVWPNWEEWISGNIDVEHPFVTFTSLQLSTVGDYLGYPTGIFSNATVKANAFPIAAYHKIYNEYYRDQNLVPEVVDVLVDGNNNTNYLDLLQDNPLRRAWHHDYFTSALPFAQKGVSVQVPLTVTDNVPVEWTALASPNAHAFLRDPISGSLAGAGTVTTTGGGELALGVAGLQTYDPNGSLVVDIQSDAVDINTLRRAFRLQEFLEKDARGGTRYIENIMAHFGVRSSDARLQRPEYIGGLKQNMIISEVLNMAQNISEDAVVGAMAGHGVSVGGGNSFTYRAEEHGWIIGVTSVMPDTAYQQGLHRSLSRFDRLDYAWPEFAQIGEQEILVKELMIGDLTDTGINQVFGYTPRFSEYKYINSRVAGDFKDTLAFWHLGRIFDTSFAPELNSDFINCIPRDDIFAVETGTDTIYAHVINNVTCVRKLPKFGIPTI